MLIVLWLWSLYQFVLCALWSSSWRVMQLLEVNSTISESKVLHNYSYTEVCVFCAVDTHGIYLVPSVVLRSEIQCHHVPADGGHLELCRSPALWRENTLILVHVAGAAGRLAPLGLFSGKNFCQRAGQRRLLGDHQNYHHYDSARAMTFELSNCSYTTCRLLPLIADWGCLGWWYFDTSQ